MNQLTAHKREYTRKQADLYLAFELGSKEWKLGFTVGFGQRPRQKAIGAGDLVRVKEEIDRAKERFGHGSPRLRRIGIVAFSGERRDSRGGYIKGVRTAKRLMGKQSDYNFSSWCELPVRNPWFSLESRQLDGAVHPGASGIA